MKVYILCYEGTDDEMTGNIISVWSSFEGAKAEALAMAEIANDIEANILANMILECPELDWTDLDADFYREEPDSILHGWHLVRESNRLVIAEYEVQHGKTVF